MSIEDESGEPGGDQLLAAEYALGLLDGAARGRFAARLAHDPALHQDLRFWQQRFAGLDDEFAETTPPPNIYAQIERRLFPATATPGLWGSLAFWRGLAAAGVVVAVLGVGFGVWAPRAPLTDPQLVAALEAQGSDVKFVAVYNRAAGTINIAAISGAAVPDKDFELWAIHGSASPVPMGLLPIDTKSSIPVSAAMQQDMAAGTVFAVSLEPKGGSPTGLPTGPIVAKGAATPI
jgi:anti-sigma-K factor RskA